VLYSFSPFAAGYSGVFVAGGDDNRDGRADRIIGVGEGPGGTSLLRTFDGQTLSALNSFQPYGNTADGIFVAAVPELGTAGWVALGCLGFLGLTLQRLRSA
jgi:hypothetical protein